MPKAQCSTHVPLWVQNSHQDRPQSLTPYGVAKYAAIDLALLEKVGALEVQAALVSERGLETAAANLHFIQEIRKG